MPVESWQELTDLVKEIQEGRKKGKLVASYSEGGLVSLDEIRKRK